MKKQRLGWLLCASLLIGSGAQASSGPDNHVSLFAGGNTSHKHTYFALGMEYERKVTESFGLGFLSDLTFSHPKSVVYAVPFFYHPMPEWKLFIAPGMLREKGENSFNMRGGLAYDYEVGGGFTVGPTVSVEYGTIHTLHWVYGIAFGMGF